ncbi:hypothetical protein MSG_04807 [Mycobacterium shigaense]|uniref:Uncharacterized protein n=1 Tax=Mycobacterium shigaense TaxID=722731 RepID=A0A1Z4EPW7_9MYCO|nr:hypothetical protein B2J96_11575 [Mycobacterium shigaense]BAX94916.1 hypothetical protein MSG_04807 [Mycobacterium shigaense]
MYRGNGPRPDAAPKRTLTILACIGCAIVAVGLAFLAAMDLYLTGFPDSHPTDYDRAARAPKRILMWLEWGLVVVFLGLAFTPVRSRTRVIASVLGLVVLVLVAAAQWIGIPWYFLTHLRLDNGIGG